MTKPEEDLADVKAIYEDVRRFARMTFEEWKAHLDAHPEDRGLHHINLPEGGSLRMSADSTDRFFALTQRLMAVTPDNADLDRSTLNDAIRAKFVDMFLRQPREIDRSSVDRMLARAVKAVRQKHRPMTRYLPCTLVGDHEPFEFRVGPVRFLHESKFFEYYGAKIEADHRDASTKQRAKAEEMQADGRIKDLMSRDAWEELDRKMLDWVPEYYKPYKWIAEVTVPACDDRISRIRAELTVQAALDVLKLFAFGWYFGGRVHLAADHGIIDKVADVVRHEDGHFAITWSRGTHWALVEDGWFSEVEQKAAGHLSAAAQIIEAYLSPIKPYDIATRWLDALNWYGQAVAERIPSAKIVKYVAALERLTITEQTGTDDDRGLTDAVTRRAALFAAGEDDDAREQRRREARDLYKLRSKLMHGQRSPVSKEQIVSDALRSSMAKADEIARHVLINALGEYVHLLMAERTKDEHLEERLRVLEAAYGMLPEDKIKRDGCVGRAAKIGGQLKEKWFSVFGGSSSSSRSS